MKGIDVEAIEAALLRIDGVREIHDFHVWSLTSGRNVLSVHVVADLSRRLEQEILADVDKVVRAFQIPDKTIQVEAGGFHAPPSSGSASNGVHEHDH